jgi:hypothetical protein
MIMASGGRIVVLKNNRKIMINNEAAIKMLGENLCEVSMATIFDQKIQRTINSVM